MSIKSPHVTSDRQYCLTLNLRDDESLIQEYELYHTPGNVWPEVVDGIRTSGILDMHIYRNGTQLIMVLTVDESFSFEAKAESDSNNDAVMRWEVLMERYQQLANGSETSSKWFLLKKVFNLGSHN